MNASGNWKYFQKNKFRKYKNKKRGLGSLLQSRHDTRQVTGTSIRTECERAFVTNIILHFFNAFVQTSGSLVWQGRAGEVERSRKGRNCHRSKITVYRHKPSFACSHSHGIQVCISGERRYCETGTGTNIAGEAMKFEFLASWTSATPKACIFS